MFQLPTLKVKANFVIKVFKLYQNSLRLNQDSNLSISNTLKLSLVIDALENNAEMKYKVGKEEGVSYIL